MKKNLVLGIFFLFASCMAKPTSQKFTRNETNFFNSLQEKCQCIINREIDIRPLKQRLDTCHYGAYALVIDSIPCNIIKQNKDSLKTVSDSIALKLHNDVLKTDFPYHYESILIMFQCWTLPNQGTHVSFSYEYKK